MSSLSQEYAELEKLSCLGQLVELSVISNPVSRRMQHRSLLIFNLPSLLSLDGVMVSPEERQTAEISFSEIQVSWKVSRNCPHASDNDQISMAQCLQLPTEPS